MTIASPLSRTEITHTVATLHKRVRTVESIDCCRNGMMANLLVAFVACGMSWYHRGCISRVFSRTRQRVVLLVHFVLSGG